MLDALQPFLEDKKQTLALNGGDDPIRLILAYFSTDNQNIDELEKLKYNKALYRRLGWQDEEWFDVISSFYLVYCCGLAWVCSGKTCNDYGADWSDRNGGDLPPFRLEAAASPAPPTPPVPSHPRFGFHICAGQS